jgi:putative Mg2+ transporter-C (MgtC) family protein
MGAPSHLDTLEAIRLTSSRPRISEAAMSWWARVAAAVRSDFSDLPDAGQAASLVIRLLIAALLGGALGYERERAGKAAGIRTHMLVSLGAALFVLIPQQAGAAPGDITRVLQGVVTGIGFLGAGTILKGDDSREVRGLTTAAGVWLTAAIGVAAGMGRVGSAVLSTVLAILILSVLPKFAR